MVSALVRQPQLRSFHQAASDAETAGVAWESDIESRDERNVARRVESQGKVVESVDDEQFLGRDSPGGPELFAMSDHDETPQNAGFVGDRGSSTSIVEGCGWQLVLQSSRGTPRSVHDELSEVEEKAIVPGAFRTHNDESPPEMSTISA